MEEQHPNWIAERAKCNMAALWKDVCDLMLENVLRINTEAGDRGWGIMYTKPADGTQRTTRYEGPKEAGECRWRYEPTSSPAQVIFTLEQPDYTATLTTRWDVAASQCLVVVQMSAYGPQNMEFPHDQLWKALQVILEPFWFQWESLTRS